MLASDKRRPREVGVGVVGWWVGGVELGVELRVLRVLRGVDVGESSVGEGGMDTLAVALNS